MNTTRSHVWRCLLIVFCVAATATSSFAQTVTLNNLPSWTSNTRFFSDEYPIKHPSLSLNGFDCGSNCSEGLGLKQILEEVYSSSPDNKIIDVYQSLLNLANESYDYSPNTANKIGKNTQRLQARAFVALATYVLDENGHNPTSLTPALPPASQALTNLRLPLLSSTTWTINGAYETDALKWATPVTNVARAIDFYLALENAYKHYDLTEYNNLNSTSLPSKTQKEGLLSEYTLLIDRLEHYGGEYAPLEEITGVDGYDVQAGNWPLKVQTAIGYALFTWQDNNIGFCPNTNCDFDGWIRRAFKSVGGTNSSDRANHWFFQSDGGKKFWAEGAFYHHLTISQVVPFWHTARINNLLSNTSLVGFSIIGDPFFNSWFTTPMNWLADSVTPDGKVPPLDDGNKREMYMSSVLRWTGSYGNNSLGQKFAWINSQPANGLGSSFDLLPVELAIPRQAAPSSNPIPQDVGNTSPGQTSDSGEQQLIVRRSDGGKSHYVLLNGESGDAINHGEGHEQPDQLQLLYYIDDISYLVDSGYDDANGLGNSTWNHYYDHNIMAAFVDPNGVGTEGGIWPPYVNEIPPKIVSNHQSVDYLYKEDKGKIDVLHGKVELMDMDAGLNLFPIADYERIVLSIEAGNGAKHYLVDINAGIRDRLVSQLADEHERFSFSSGRLLRFVA